VTDPVFLGPTEAGEGDLVRLTGEEGRHAARVRRLRPGERFGITDGSGLLLRCRVVAVDRDEITASVVVVEEVPPPQPRIVVAQALPKGERAEAAVTLLTEAGVDEILPWQASRCVVQWRGERADRGLARWRSAAREAAKQSRRVHHPIIGDPITTTELTRRSEAAELAVVLHESAALGLAGVDPPQSGEILLVVGPEGGIAEEELEQLAASGAQPRRLGPEVTRTSSAGALATAVLASRTARWDPGS
jgi:16S rRNA (uracil1498-N3)-methyltransferase